MRFSQIIGLDDLKEVLIHSIRQGHVAHAQLFFGKEGCANLALALAYATMLNCENKNENSTDSCGTCPSCYKYDRLVHPDLHFIFPTATTKQITKREEAVSAAFLKEWRTFVQGSLFGNVQDWSTAMGAEGKQCIIPVEDGRNIIRSLSLKAFEAEYKVLLIWLPELMNPSTANAILKILEEPAPKTVFFLVSNHADSLLITIQSRTQKVLVRSFTEEEIQRALMQTADLSSERAAQIAILAQGNMREALRLLHDAKDLSQDAFREWMRLCFKSDLPALIKEAERFSTIDKEQQKSLLQYGLSMIREALVFNAGEPKLVRLDQSVLDFIKNFSKVITLERADALSEQLSKAIFHIERNANSKILFLDLSIAIAAIFKK